MSVLTAAPAFASAKPFAETKPPKTVSRTKALLDGIVNPNGLETIYRFEYGTTLSYGKTTPEVSAGSGTSNLEETAVITGLKESTTYHVRLIAYSEYGTAFGADKQFATPPRESWSLWEPLNISGAERNELRGVSCAPYNYACTAVGRHLGATSGATAERWNGTGWKLQETKTPTGATRSELASVSCTSETTCTAVGFYSVEGISKTLAEQWNGTEWKIQTTPNPAGSKSSDFNGVSCTSATACTAVGYSEGNTLAERWRGSEWSIEATPNPSGSERSSLTSVYCISSTECVAAESSYHTKDEAQVQRWNGNAWTIEEVPSPKGATALSLQGISCPPSSVACIAVGRWSNTEHRYGWSVRWNPGTGWTSEEPSRGKNSETALEGISCSSSTQCTAVGDAGSRTFADQWNGAEWAAEEPKNAGTEGRSYLSGVSCEVIHECMAVGNYWNTKTTNATLADLYE